MPIVIVGVADVAVAGAMRIVGVDVRVSPGGMVAVAQLVSVTHVVGVAVIVG